MNKHKAKAFMFALIAAITLASAILLFDELWQVALFFAIVAFFQIAVAATEWAVGME